MQKTVQRTVEELEDRTLFTALYWDPSHAAVAGGGSGTWNTVEMNWRSGSATGPLVAWSNSADDDAIFPAGSGTVVLGSNITAKSLTFKTSGYEIENNTLLMQGGNGKVDVAGGASATINSVIAGSVGLDKVDSGNLMLGAGNTYTGQTIVAGGTVNLANAEAAQNSAILVGVNNGVTFAGGISAFRIGGLAGSKNLAMTDASNDPVSLAITNSSSAVTYSGILSGAGAVQVLKGSETFSGANTFSGGITLAGGQLNLNNAKALGSGRFTISGGTIDNTSGNALTLKGNNSLLIGGSFTFDGRNTLTFGTGPVALTGNATLNVAQKNLIFSGSISDQGAGVGITKIGAGTLILNVADTFSGPTVINGGIVRLGAAAALGNSDVVVNEANGLQFTRTINFYDVGGLSGGAAESLANGSSKINTILTGGNGGNDTYAGALSGTGALEVVGGILHLKATNSYSGGTTVAAGTLLVDATGGTGSGAVTVAGGSALGGTGSVAGAVSVQGGGTLTPGDGGTAAFTTGALTLSSAAKLDIQLNSDSAGSGYDQLKVNGAATVAGSNLVLSGAKTAQDGAALTIINATGTVTGNFQSLPQNGTTEASGVIYATTYGTHTATLTADTAVAGTSNPAPTGGSDPVAPPVQISVQPLTSGPTGLSVAAPSSSEIDVSWNGVSGATGYVVQRSTSATSGFVSVATPTTTSWADAGESPSTTFYYRVAGFNSLGDSSFSAAVSTASLNSTAINATISGNATANHGVLYSLNLSAATGNRYPADVPAQTWTINWGDGTASQPDLMVVSGQVTAATHTYLSTGVETISAVATSHYGNFTANPLTVTVGNAPTVTAFQVNDGSAQRSMVKSLTVNFSEPVLLTANSFQLTQTAATGVTSTAPMGFSLTSANNGQTYVLTFPQSTYAADIGDSLPNGTYALTVLASQVTDQGGAGMQSSAHFKFDRLFGDFDGSGVVDSADENVFDQAFGSSAGEAGYLAAADVDSDGAIDANGMTALGQDMGESLQPSVALGNIPQGMVGNALTLNAAGNAFASNGDLVSYQWTVTGPNGVVSLPGGNVTSENTATFIPDVAGTWTVSVVATDTDLGLSKGTTAQSFVVSANTAPKLLNATFGTSGLATLSYNGQSLAGPSAAGSDPTFGLYVGVTEANGTAVSEMHSAGVWNAANMTETFTAPDYVATVQYTVVQNTLGFNISLQNTSTTNRILKDVQFQLITGMKFPSMPTGFSQGGPSMAFDTLTPSYVNADYSTGAAVVGIVQQTPGYIGYFNTHTTNVFTPTFFTSSTLSGLPSSWPTLTSPIAANHSATYTTFLRFGATGSGSTLAADVNQAFATANPFSLNWTDRRPIGELIPAGSSASSRSSTNPRGWFNDPRQDVTTTAGLTNFSHALLSYADKSVAELLHDGAQGMITWDLEGEQYTGVTYVGDPTEAVDLAPELNTTLGIDAGYSSLIDEYFAKFRNAGLKVGVTLRDTQVEFVNGTPQQVPVSDPAQLLISKIEYAKARWGCTLFYIDSIGYGGDANGTWGVASILDQVHAAEPDVLLIPEHNDGIGGNAVAASYAEIPSTTLTPGVDAITPTAVQEVYSDAFRVTRVDKTRAITVADLPGVTAGIARGDTFFFPGWYHPSVNDVMKQAYSDIAFNDTSAGGVVYSGDTFVLRLSTPAIAADAQYQIWRDGLLVDSMLVSSTSSINLHFKGVNDSLVVDTSGGNPIPVGGLTFNGDNVSNGDSLSVLGMPGGDVVNVLSGRVNVGTRTISVSNVLNVSSSLIGANNSALDLTGMATPESLTATPMALSDGSSSTSGSASSSVNTAAAMSTSFLAPMGLTAKSGSDSDDLKDGGIYLRLQGTGELAPAQ